MAVKKKFEFEAVLLAAGGGIATAPLMNMLQENVFKKKPEIVPAVTLGAGLALQYFGGKKVEPAALGIIAVSAGELASNLIARAGKGDDKSFDLSGFSRVSVASKAVNNIPQSFTDQVAALEASMDAEYNGEGDGTE